MRRVLVVRDELLPLSETFVRQQALHLRDWRATLVPATTVPVTLGSPQEFSLGLGSTTIPAGSACATARPAGACEQRR